MVIMPLSPLLEKVFLPYLFFLHILDDGPDPLQFFFVSGSSKEDG